jgi:sec-independent protein translocase protein TatC
LEENLKSEGEEMSFLEHLEELRWHLVRSVVATVLFMIVAFVSRRFIFDTIILKPKSPEFFTNRMFSKLGAWMHQQLGTSPDMLNINTAPLEIVNIDMAGQFTSHIKVSLVAGLIMASPYIIWQIWSFIKPALFDKERQYARGGVFFTTALFLLGVLFGYFLIAPLSIHFLGSYNVSPEVANTIKLNSYISTITSVTFASGVVFELPIAIYFLSRIGLITSNFMKKYRKHAYILLLILSAIITPPDVFSQILVCIPLGILLEVSIHVARSIERKRAAEALKAE